MKRLLTAALLGVALLSPFAARAETAPAHPITMMLAWDGEACNDGGHVRLTITNVSAADIVMPKDARVGLVGAWLVGAARVNGGEVIISDNFAPPEMPPREGSPLPVRRLRPGESTTYSLQLDQTNGGQMEGSPHFAFDTAYRQIRRSKGVVWLHYSLRHKQDGSLPYVLDSGVGIMIGSNSLRCPAS